MVFLGNVGTVVNTVITTCQVPGAYYTWYRAVLFRELIIRTWYLVQSSTIRAECSVYIPRSSYHHFLLFFHHPIHCLHLIFFLPSFLSPSYSLLNANSRNSDSESHIDINSRLFLPPPLCSLFVPGTSCVHRERRLEPFLSSPTRVELRPYNIISYHHIIYIYLVYFHHFYLPA